MKFVLKFERCTSACYPYNVALAWIKFHTPVGFSFFQAEIANSNCNCQQLLSDFIVR